MYKPIDPKQSFPALEEDVLKFWEDNDIFKKSIAQREGNEEFTFYDGPPFATGLPHFGHFVPSTIKDIIPRYQTMRGKKVDRRFGWDCHGLPVENLIEKDLGLNSKTDIENYGIGKFNEACRASVLRYTGEWRRIITRLGRWVDFDNDYKTMEPDYMESIWAVMKALWDKGLLYEGHYILPYCPRCATVLSAHELNLGGYKDVHDPAITVRFKIKEGEVSPSLQSAAHSSATPPKNSTRTSERVPPTKVARRSADMATATENVSARSAGTPRNAPSAYFLAWTTTPWTLPSNLALTLGADIDYVMAQTESGDCYILAQARLDAYKKELGEIKILWTKKGDELKGIKYEPLFPYFAEASEQNAFKTYLGDFVSTEDGTGIVHTAPGFGEDDNRILRGTGVPTICPIDAECKFTADVPDYAGQFVKDCDKDIIERLKNEGKLLRRDQILHAYPHCWRCGHPLIYRAVGSWFVDVQKIKADMLLANSQIKWVPDHIKDGRFGKWLLGARDWAITRNRYWGNPLPIWKCTDCGKTICVGSRAELKELAVLPQEPQDLHKHFVDKITIKCECGGTMHRIPEVLDCWFESGAMPYAQQHYPFENKEFFESHFPADFINEGLDQTRGWFYTLTILAAALFKRPAFKNCIVSGLVLASDGKKMSKSLRNFTDPMEAVNMFGADALRLFLIHSAVVKADDLRYNDEGVRDVLKSIILPLWNAYGFFVTYANIDKITAGSIPLNPANPLDKWILSASTTLIKNVTLALDGYNMAGGIDPILNFIDLLNNWYIRRSRRRFWRSENDSDKMEAYSCLHAALKTLITVACPFMPFTTEAIWQNLRSADEPISIHLASWPLANEKLVDNELEFKMSCVQNAVSLGRALRSKYDIKVRQPLQMVELVTRNTAEKNALLEMREIIGEELNVKEVKFSDNEDELVEYSAKANFRVLGKELGQNMKAAAEKIAAFGRGEITAILEGNALSIEVAGQNVDITADKLDIKRTEKAGFRVINEGSLTVALDTAISETLRREGDVRDLVRGVQNLRKESGLDVSDRIKLTVFGSDKLKAAYESFTAYIASETLASQIEWASKDGQKQIDSGDENWAAAVERIEK
ncbi:MAG: isoleucine--tRNA ligase [Termitinemataceae bacterium]|nr:MAG: isoleucine--tRNA ligase [Termitinemataceae bacterium]